MSGPDHVTAPPVLGSVASAFGLALGELLLALDRADDLGRCLAEIHIAAEGTMLSSERAHRTIPREEH